MSVLKNIRSRFVSLLLIITGLFFCSAQLSTTREYQIKAAFLFNFMKFVEWPSNGFSSAQAPAVIGVLGKDPFGTYLEETITGESINNHPLVIQHFDNVDEVGNCHILFINLTDKNKLRGIIEKLKGRNILTVSDANGFAKLGGMIELYNRDDKINIQINLEATKAENLLVSSKLLKLAEIVKTDKK